MINQHIILALGWILFCVWHSLLADVAVKYWLSLKLKKHFKFFRLYYTIFASVSFAIIVLYEVYLPTFNVFSPNLFSKASGLAIGASGLLIMAICIYKYFRQLSGLKTLFIDEVRTGNNLIVTGIHRHVRHPLYAGTFLFIWGLFIFLPLCSLLISNFIITVYTLIGIRFEEKKLVKEFGIAYKEYQQSVPMIIPYPKPPSNS